MSPDDVEVVRGRAYRVTAVDDEGEPTLARVEAPTDLQVLIREYAAWDARAIAIGRM